jgi:hypothetical protein
MEKSRVRAISRTNTALEIKKIVRYRGPITISL